MTTIKPDDPNFYDVLMRSKSEWVKVIYYDKNKKETFDCSGILCLEQMEDNVIHIKQDLHTDVAFFIDQNYHIEIQKIILHEYRESLYWKYNYKEFIDRFNCLYSELKITDGLLIQFHDQADGDCDSFNKIEERTLDNYCHYVAKNYKLIEFEVPHRIIQNYIFDGYNSYNQNDPNFLDIEKNKIVMLIKK